MIYPALHSEESARLKALRRLDILYETNDNDFDQLTKMAAYVFHVPIALISFVEEDKQYFKSNFGTQMSQTERAVSFCGHTILEESSLIVEDALQDKRFFDNPLVVSGPKIRFYTGVPYFSPDGYPLGSICVIDIKPRKVTTEEIEVLKSLSSQVTNLLLLKKTIKDQQMIQDSLKFKEQEARALLNGVPSLIGHWSKDVTLINCNGVYESFFGDLALLKGKHAKEVLGEELYQKNIPFIDKALQGEESQFEREILKPDGSVAYAHIGFRPHFVDGKVESFFSISTDITSVKKAEQIRRELEQKLINSERLSLLGEISCGIAHEVNNPLQIILSRLAILKHELMNPLKTKEEIETIVNKIENAVGRITKIVRGLQTYSRNSENDPFRKVAILEIINDSISLCQDRFKQEQVKVVVNCAEGIYINCRAAQISQVIINLLMNAADALQLQNDKSISLIVQADEKITQLKIADNGPGIPPQLRDKIMEPFFTTKEVGKGTGLGLSISSGIIEDHQGNLSLESDSNQTVFVITLPTLN